jgi:DNA-binding response OmpR family regulator
VVVAGADEQDRIALNQALIEIGGREHWNVEFTNVCEDAWTIAHQLTAPVILCDRELAEIEWRDAVQTLSALPHRPMVILLSKVTDESLWSEVFRIGGFDILTKPLRAKEIRRVVNLALSYWRSEAVTVAKKSG